MSVKSWRRVAMMSRRDASSTGAMGPRVRGDDSEVAVTRGMLS
jgi:hypothetical protein